MAWSSPPLAISDLWLQTRRRAAARSNGATGFLPKAYEKLEKSTNGVEFIVDGEQPDGTKRRIYYRVLDPMQKPADQR